MKTTTAIATVISVAVIAGAIVAMQHNYVYYATASACMEQKLEDQE